MRLIDANELKKKLWSPTETYICEDIVTEEEIDETPTAYDIDKVVERLENASCYIEDGNGHAGHLVFTDEAIKIVKGGAE